MGFYDILPLFHNKVNYTGELTKFKEESSILSADYYSCSYSSRADNLKGDLQTCPVPCSCGSQDRRVYNVNKVFSGNDKL
ncbi:hypothetical protein CEXT_670871 [Caerostris extrusa]|uniref:Uncharacterized protein n=1 Tax=Caerostris extrusa TaxID=172846 RepID=A0AAV4MRH1_CAEEX|nr:hypothetical protein CEXT_670871 [Caerostris extrusa]